MASLGAFYCNLIERSTMANESNAKKEKEFSKVEKELIGKISKDLYISPIRFDEDGYYYDGKEFLDKLIVKLQNE